MKKAPEFSTKKNLETRTLYIREVEKVKLFIILT